jgi:alpha-ketoglutarate-dependent taurine dioxygenase
MIIKELRTGNYAIFVKDRGTDCAEPERAAVVDALKTAGAVIFRGYFAGLDEFIAFSDRFTASYVPYVGGANNGRQTVGGNGSVYTVTEPSMKMPIPLHGEMYYSHTRPDLVWFYCINPAAANGETTLCDGGEILAQLSPATRRQFEENDILYRRNFSKSVWQSSYQTDDVAELEAFCRANNLELTVHADGGISTAYRASAIVRSPNGDGFINSILTFAAQEYIAGSTESQVRWSDGREIDRAILLEVKNVSDRLTLAHAWQPGDLIMVDNTRVMHGRRSFNDDQRNIVVRLGMLAA